MKAFYTLDDLRNPSEDADNIFLRDEQPARLAVIGDPIAHSKSPQLHQPALDHLGINATYIRVHLTADEFDEGVSLMQELGFIGCNVTVPHKERALAWAETPDSFSSQVGVANTILFAVGTCYTTDPIGLESALVEDFDYRLQGASLMVLGAGGGAGSAVAQYMVSQDPFHLYLYNRSPERLDATSGKIIESCAIDQTKVSYFTQTDFPHTGDIDLIINATSLGLKESDPCPIPSELIQAHHKVYDMTYGCENALSQACKAIGAQYTDGLSMLRHQGAEAFKLWFPIETDGIDVPSIMGLR